MSRHRMTTTLSVFSLLFPACFRPSPAAEPPVRLNQIQVIGSHNSYHIEPSDGVKALIAASGKSNVEGLEYTHPPLARQFSEQGIRQIELDLFADPEGGHYAEPAARKIVRAMGKDPGPDHDPAGLLRRPGTKVLHVQDIDYRSSAPTLLEALKQVREWSAGHPRHVPIMILLELKEEANAALPTKPLPFDRMAIETIEKEILSVFPRGSILTPDDVRGTLATLSEAVRSQGWPALDAVRSRVIFALDNEDAIRDRYLEGHPTLQGRLMFASVAESHPAAAWFKINDPINDHERIRRLVHDGFLVRTRSDANTVQARRNDATQREKALSSGAQFISTDYAVPDPRYSSYTVQLPGRVIARSNPISGRSSLSGRDLERE